MEEGIAWGCPLILLAMNLLVIERGWTGGAVTNRDSASADWSPSPPNASG